MAILLSESKKIHDLRLQELAAEKKENKLLIDLLKKERKSPQFFARFTKYWNNQDSVLTTNDLKLEKQNKRSFVVLAQELIATLNNQQRQKLSSQLISMSQTFSEMANE